MLKSDKVKRARCKAWGLSKWYLQTLVDHRASGRWADKWVHDPANSHLTAAEYVNFAGHKIKHHP